MLIALTLLLCGVAASLGMAGLWVLQRRIDDAGIVDVAWGLGIAIFALVYFFVVGGANFERSVVALAVVWIWAIRLGLHVFTRLLQHKEDGRYQNLKAAWGDKAQSKLFYFYQAQAFGSWLFSLPLLLTFLNAAAWNVLDYVGIGVVVVAVVGESIADWQLSRFRNNPANKGKVCNQGLWKYSRHPNYFFEWCHWWAYVCFAAAAPFGWLAILGPLSMLYFILKVTGIPPTEAQAIRSRGDAYREYQRTTSPFFPWPPRSRTTA